MPVAPCANARFVVYRCVVLCGLSALIRHEESQCLLFVVLVVDSFCCNLAIVRCERSDGDAISSLDITDKVTLLKRRLTAAEDLLEVTALGLQKTATEVCTGAVYLGLANRAFMFTFWPILPGKWLQLVPLKPLYT